MNEIWLHEYPVDMKEIEKLLFMTTGTCTLLACALTTDHMDLVRPTYEEWGMIATR